MDCANLFFTVFLTHCIVASPVQGHNQLIGTLPPSWYLPSSLMRLDLVRRASLVP